MLHITASTTEYRSKTTRKIQARFKWYNTLFQKQSEKEAIEKTLRE